MSIRTKWKKLKSKWISEKVPSHIEEYFVAGQRFRVIKQYGSNLFVRNQAFQQAAAMIERNVTDKDILDICALQKEALNKGDVVNAATMINTLEALVKSGTSTRILTLIGNTFILLDGEDEGKMEEEFQLKKLQLLEKSEEIRAFFLAIVDVILSQGSYLSKPIPIKDYMNNGKQYLLENHTFRMMGKSVYSQDLIIS